MMRWLRVLVSVGLLALLFWILPWPQVRDAALRLPPLTWLGALAGFVVGHALGVVKWRSFVALGRAALRASQAAMCYGAGLFANLCLPTIVGGDVLRAALAGRLSRRPEAAVIGGVLDRLTDVIALTLLSLGGALFARTAIAGLGRTVITVALVVGGIILAGSLPFLGRLPLARWPRRVRRPVGRALVALRRVPRQPRTATIGLMLSLAIQGSFVLLNRSLGRSIGIDVDLAVWFMAWPLAKLAGLLPISLGGLAVRDATLGALLVPFGVPLALGVVGSLLWQTVLIAGGLLGGLAWLVLSRRGPNATLGLRDLKLGSPRATSHA
jgi:uncharacterized membrane protein YbhN (UPF0104 family)